MMKGNMERIITQWFRRHREQLKTLLIVVFIAGAAAQSAMLWARVLTRDSIPWPGLRAHAEASAKLSEKTDHRAGAMPVRFAVRNEEGIYGIQYNQLGLEEAYEETAAVWAQACAHTKKGTAVDTETYRRALLQPMMMMQYDGLIPMEIVAGWLGCELPEALSGQVVGSMALCQEKDGYMLYLRDSAKNIRAAVPTSVDKQAFDAAITQFEPNDCTLGAEQDKTVSPDLLYFPGGESFDMMLFDNYTGGDGMYDILTAFDMDAETALDRAYAADRVMVYVSGRNTVHIGEDGLMRFEGNIRLPVQAGEHVMQCVQMGSDLTGEILEAIDCGASASLISAYRDADTGHLITVYGMQIGGVPVDNTATGYFARYEFDANALIRAHLALRTCQSSGETITVMPEKQVAASLQSVQDAQLHLRYVDRAVDTGSTWDTTGADDVWNAENQEVQDTENWEELSEQAETQADAGTPVMPQWYVLRYGEEEILPEFGRTIEPEDIVYVRPDFDRMIQGGHAS